MLLNGLRRSVSASSLLSACSCEGDDEATSRMTTRRLRVEEFTRDDQLLKLSPPGRHQYLVSEQAMSHVIGLSGCLTMRWLESWAVPIMRSKSVYKLPI